jgi:D-methionine transport system substrate-binding protein
MRKLLCLFVISLFVAFSASVWAQDTIKVATTSGPDVDILEKAVEVAKSKGLNVEIIEFSDYVQPNLVLLNKEVDLNSFQHVPFLDDFNKERNANLVSLGFTYVAPIAYFSSKISKIEDLKEGDSVVVPDDPSNGGRCLLLLQKAGYIKVDPAKGLNPNRLDVIENKLNLNIIEVQAQMTPQAREDATIVCINNTFSVKAGLYPLYDGLYVEAEDSPYANIIAARPEDKDNPN